MAKNESKISTSIQYQLSNVVLFNEIFGNWNNFNDTLDKGPAEMKKYLFDKWNKIKENLKSNNNLVIKDIDKEISVDDFDITFNRTKNGTSVFFITFPDYNYTDGASKFVALALTPNMPRYFTLEYSKHAIDSSPCWVIGEFIIAENKKKHINYDTTDNMRLTWFAGYILGKLEVKNH